MRLRPRAEVLCFKGPRVLAAYHEDGYVCFPGGGIDPNETAIEAAKREAREEAGRRVITCTPAHPPTMQKWPEGYAAKKGNEWAKEFHGGITYWLTGSTSDDPIDTSHEDYVAGFDWKPIADVMSKLKAEVSGDWADDVRVRLKILETHLDNHRRHKAAALGLPDLPLHLSPGTIPT